MSIFGNFLAILGVSKGPSGVQNEENVIKNSVLFRKRHFLPHFGGFNPPIFPKSPGQGQGVPGGPPGPKGGKIEGLFRKSHFFGV